MKNRKIVFAFAILMTNALFAQKTHFQMSSLRPDADSAFTCRVTAKYDNGRFVQYTGCTICRMVEYCSYESSSWL